MIGGGLAGTEAAWRAAEAGAQVTLYEMRPQKSSPAHQSGELAELVCSNSLRANQVENAVGLLKEEMRRLGSLIMRVADAHRVPAGAALAVDRRSFSRAVTEAVEAHPRITVCRQEIAQLPETGVTVVASGPLTSEALSAEISRLIGGAYLHFYDAAAPIVTEESLDMTKVFRASRYGKGDLEAGDYLNCPFNKEEYLRFYQALLQAERHQPHDFEKKKVFEGCMPIEIMAERGEDTIRYGPMKPVGLIDPRSGEEPYAVVQLRHDDNFGLYNLVGFQTSLSWGAQQQVFRLIPGLEQAEFVRYGVMHRNTFINSPKVLAADLSLPGRDIFFAGQMTGVEGYVESAACGLFVGEQALRRLRGQAAWQLPPETALGSLMRYVTAPNPLFQPMNVTFGLFPPLGRRVRGKRERNMQYAERALAALDSMLAEDRDAR